MTDSLFKQLQRIGIDDELASQVSASLDPDHNASKKDILVLQEAILQMQIKSDERYFQIREDIGLQRSELKEQAMQLKMESDRRYHELKNELVKGLADVRVEHHSLHRHSIFAFGAILVSIFTVLAVNIYQISRNTPPIA